MKRNAQGKFVKKNQPEGFLCSRDAIAKELQDAGKALTKSVCEKTVERARAVEVNAARVLKNAEAAHELEQTEVTKSLENKAWMQWREAAQTHQLAVMGVLDEKVHFLRLAQKFANV